jgi:hypothetical protein
MPLYHYKSPNDIGVEGRINEPACSSVNWTEEQQFFTFPAVSFFFLKKRSGCDKRENGGAHTTG